MADDTAVKITIAADLDGSVAASANAAKEQIDSLSVSAAQFQAALKATGGDVSAITPEMLGMSSGASAAADGMETLATAQTKAAGSSDLLNMALRIDERMLIRLATMGAVFGGIELAKGFLESAAAIQQQADALGMDVTAYQDFTGAATLAGVQQQVAQQALTHFVSAQAEALDATQRGEGATNEQAQAFQRLGVAIGIPTNESLPAIAAALLKTADGSENAKDKLTLFGNAGKDVADLLPQWAQGTDALTHILTELGIILDPKVTAAAQQAQVKLDTSFARMKTDWTPAVVGLTDALSDFAEALSGASKADQSGLFYGPGGVVNLGGGSTTTVPSELEADHAKSQKQSQAALAQTAQAWAPTAPAQGPDVEAPDIAAINQAAEAQQRAAEQARKLTDDEAQSVEQLALKRISAAESANNFELQMGDESLDQWKANATEEANAKLAAELAYLQKKAAADKGNVVEEQKDQDAIKAAHQENANALAAIDQQYAEKKRAIDQQELQEFISADNAKLQDGIRALDAEYKEHQITAQQRYTLEQQLTEQIYAEELKRLDALLATLTQGTKAWQQAMDERQKLEQQLTKQSETNTNQLAEEESQKWTQLGNSIESSFNSSINGMLLQGKTFEQSMRTLLQGVLGAFLQLAEEMAETWLVTQAKNLLASTTTDTQQTQAAAAAAAAQTATVATQKGALVGLAGAGGVASMAAAPYPLDLTAPAFGASMAQDAASYAALATGAYNVPRDMPAYIHAGEMVIPRTFAEDLRSNISGGGYQLSDMARQSFDSRSMALDSSHFAGGNVTNNGGTTNHFTTDYHPSWSGRDPITPQEFFRNNHNEIIGEIKRLVRNGSLAF